MVCVYCAEVLYVSCVRPLYIYESIFVGKSYEETGLYTTRGVHYSFLQHMFLRRSVGEAESET